MDKEWIIITEYVERTSIERSFIASLEEYGLIRIHEMENELFLDSDELPQLEKYARMYYDLSINMEGIDAIHHLVERINQLNKEIRTLKDRLTPDDLEF
ncbi:chaperone modulator CbpM [Bacteroidales bacterium OttesenSCG-928-A17]|nr:chaperone modulator CbpM [Bacteroidales bacterium OttesenSCG-928-A17]